MSVSRRAILAAIHEESRQRRGPVPMRLVSIAVNAAGQAAQLDVESKLLALRTEGLVAMRQDLRGSGLVLTDTGRVLLEQPDEIGNAKPAAMPEAQAAETTPEPEAVEAPPPSDVAATVSSPSNLAPRLELYELLCDVAGLVSEQLGAAIDDGDHPRALELHDLGTRILRETGGPR